MGKTTGNRPADPSRGLERELAQANARINRLELQLHVLTTTDGLTGLANRNGTLDSIEAAVARRHRMGEPFAVVGFRFPQLAGLLENHDIDDVAESVCHLAALLAAGLRTVDKVGRMDDETFVAVLSDIVATNIPVVVDRTLASIRVLPLRVGTAEYELEPSVAAMIPGEDTPTAAVFLDTLESVLGTARGAFTIDTLG